MTQPLFPSTIGTQSRSPKVLTLQIVVRLNQKNDSQTGSHCLDKAVLAQGGGGGYEQTQRAKFATKVTVPHPPVGRPHAVGDDRHRSKSAQMAFTIADLRT